MSTTHPPTALTDAEIAAVEVLAAFLRRANHYTLSVGVTSGYPEIGFSLQGHGAIVGGAKSSHNGSEWTRAEARSGHLCIREVRGTDIASRLAEAEAERDRYRETIAAVTAPPSTAWAPPDAVTQALPAVGGS